MEAQIENFFTYNSEYQWSDQLSYTVHSNVVKNDGQA